jgi:hypothetical protein
MGQVKVVVLNNNDEIWLRNMWRATKRLGARL